MCLNLKSKVYRGLISFLLKCFIFVQVNLVEGNGFEGRKLWTYGLRLELLLEYFCQARSLILIRMIQIYSLDIITQLIRVPLYKRNICSHDGSEFAIYSLRSHFVIYHHSIRNRRGGAWTVQWIPQSFRINLSSIFLSAILRFKLACKLLFEEVHRWLKTLELPSLLVIQLELRRIKFIVCGWSWVFDSDMFFKDAGVAYLIKELLIFLIHRLNSGQPILLIILYDWQSFVRKCPLDKIRRMMYWLALLFSNRYPLENIFVFDLFSEIGT